MCGESYRRAVGLSLLALCLPAASPGQAPPLHELDAYVARAMRAWEVPGVAIAIVKDDSVVYARGYGVRERGGAPVDPHTVFPVGSTTKAFAAASAALLVAEGRLEWDDRVSDHLSEFALRDPYVTRELTVRDMLSHRSGLPRGDLMWMSGGVTRTDVVRRLRHLEPIAGFREGFGYQNALYLVAGLVIEAVTGEPWEALVARRILEPIGMTDAGIGLAALRASGNVAAGHLPVEGSIVPVPPWDLEHVAPAGALSASALDMARWVRLQLADGVLDGRRVVDSAALLETRTPQTLIRSTGLWRRWYPDSRFLAYGMGWFVAEYRSRLVVDHPGGIGGFVALVSMMPEERLGLVVLTNHGENLLPLAVAYRVFDAYLGPSGRDWIAEYRSLTEELRRGPSVLASDRAARRAAGTTPSLPLGSYAGTYTAPAFGELVIRTTAGGLTVGYGTTLAGPLEHWHYDTFRASWSNPTWRALPGGGFLTFELDADARPAAVVLEVFPGERVRFERRNGQASRPRP